MIKSYGRPSVVEGFDAVRSIHVWADGPDAWACTVVGHTWRWPASRHNTRIVAIWASDDDENHDPAATINLPDFRGEWEVLTQINGGTKRGVDIVAVRVTS